MGQFTFSVIIGYLFLIAVVAATYFLSKSKIADLVFILVLLIFGVRGIVNQRLVPRGAPPIEGAPAVIMGALAVSGALLLVIKNLRGQ